MDLRSAEMENPSMKKGRPKRGIEVDRQNRIKIQFEDVLKHLYDVDENYKTSSLNEIFDELMRDYFGIQKSHEIIGTSTQFDELKGQVPPQIKRKPYFDLPNKISPAVGGWEEASTVRYAVQYKIGKFYSKLGPWSKTAKFDGKMCPLLGVPVAANKAKRLVYRQFDEREPQLVAVLDSETVRFRDVNRDIYNAASNLDEDVAMHEFEVLLGIGGNVSTVFENGRKPIHAAAENGNLRIMTTYMTKDYHAKDDDGYTPLHYAVESDHDGFIETLKEDVNSKNNLGLTPLHIAAYEGYPLTMKKLIENGANSTVKDARGFTPFHHAIFNGFYFTSLMNDEKSNKDLTPMHIASINNDLESTKALVAKNANINATTFGGFNALHLATIFGDRQMVEFLIENKIDANAKAVYDWTPLHFAVALKRIDIVSSIANYSTTDINARGAGSVTPIHLAVITRQEDVLNALFLSDKRVLIEAKTDEGFTPLHFAAKFDDLKIASFLIDNGADIGAKTLKGFTPIFLSGDITLVKMFAKKGKNLENRDVDGKTYGMFAAEMGRLDLVKYYVESDNGFDEKDKKENNLLHFAALGGHYDVVEYLYDNHRRRLFTPNNDGVYPFHLAAIKGSSKIYKYLIEYDSRRYYRLEDKAGNTALHYAAKNGNIDVLRFIGNALREYGDFNIYANKLNNANETPLDLAFSYHWYTNKDDAVVYLASMSAKGAMQRTALHLAAIDGRLDVAKRLIEETKYNLKEVDSAQKTPLFYAFENKHLELVKYFIEKGSNFSELGYSPIHKAIEVGDMNLVKFLLQNKFDIETRDESQRTPLHEAAKYGRLDMVKYFVQKGAQVNAMDEHDETPVHFAAEEDHLEILKYFAEKTDADMTAVNDQNRTPLELALVMGKTEAAKYLESHSKRTRRSLPFDFAMATKTPNNENLPLISHSKAEINHRPSSIIQDINGTLLFFDVLIRKVTGRKYVCETEPMPSSEAQACALNIAQEFQEIMKTYGIKDLDFYQIYKEIASKVTGCKFHEISPLLTSYARKSGIKSEELERLVDELQRGGSKKKLGEKVIRCWLKLKENKE